MRIAFQEAIDNAPSVIFIDDVESVCLTRDGANIYQRGLTVALLEALNNITNSGKQIVFLGATTFPSLMDGAMRDGTYMVPVPLPNQEARAQYFANPKKLGILTLEDGLTYEYMADVTDNYSYRDLDRITYAIKIEAKELAISKHSVLDEDGNVDMEKSVAAVSEAIKRGEVVLTRALFDQTRKNNPPSNKTEILEELLAFEREITNG